MSTLNNSVQLIGHLGKDVEIRTFDNGNVLGNVSLATNDRYKKKSGELVENTIWHRLVVRGKLAETMDSITRKGSQVAVKGSLVYRDYEDKAGVKKYVTEINVTEFVLLGKKATAESAA